ncbi:DUF4411 family protein [Brevibacterium sp.]|uniref:DUF4411 family protein n=1 Tax=Brevibacterium sp. TaxID=1701 RepID=UPI00281177B8|nr:DUF4411 family protein [Brevibacterium sp.]
MYLLDANVLIEAKNRYYSFETAPGFWDWLELMHQKSGACSIDAVFEELTVGDDELAHWARQHQDFFREVDRHATRHFAELTGWAVSQSYTDAALAGFTGNNADYLLVAHARGHDFTVVTHERSKPLARKRVLIPDACQAMNVKTLDTFEMLRRTEARFDLRQGTGISNLDSTTLF